MVKYSAVLPRKGQNSAASVATAVPALSRVPLGTRLFDGHRCVLDGTQERREIDIATDATLLDP
ncbi:MAG: hypothetical protein EOO39_28240 [Cytophagaceae bacterium]|nr:MAG: hypothetical protein EOO39_28240 [Cytophagaceae bacterium]